MSADTIPNLIDRQNSRHGQLTAVSMMKDEGPYVLEWIAHHLALGFTDIVVYTNDCSDGTDDILIRLEELGYAHHRRNIIPPGLKPQPSAINYAQNDPVVRGSDWVLVFDADEFLCIKYGDGTLPSLLDAIAERGANGIVITWRMFGSGGVENWSSAPVTEQYLQAAPQEWNKGWGVKTLFKFDATRWKLGIHRPKIKNKWVKTDFPDTIKWLNGSGKPMEDYFRFRGWRSISRTVGYDWVQMNHYAVKSMESYVIRRLRGNVNSKKDKYNGDYWALQDRNESHDDSALRHAAKRREIMEVLLADPVLRDLHDTAISRVESRLAELRGTDSYTDLLQNLRAASLVPISEVKTAPPKPRDPARIAEKMQKFDPASESAGKTLKVRAADQPKSSKNMRDAPDHFDGDGLQWHENSGVLLPADRDFFSPSQVKVLVAGMLEHDLLHDLGQLLARSRKHLEIGPGSGLRSAYLARTLPDLQQIIHEEHAGTANFVASVWQKNGIPRTGAAAKIVSGKREYGKFLATHAPDSLLVADTGLDPAALRDALIASGCRPLILITGRALTSIAGFRAALCKPGTEDAAPATLRGNAGYLVISGDNLVI